MLAATKVKVSGSEKNRANRNTNIFCIKRVNRNLKEVSRFSGAKQRQGNVQKKVCCKCKVAFLLFGSIVVVFYRSRCLHLVFSISRFYIFEETINIKEGFAFNPS